MKLKTLLACILTLAVSTTNAAQAEPLFVLTNTNTIVTIESTSPTFTRSTVTISGLQVGESILGIDMRPSTNVLFALGSTGRLYTINLNTGAATLVGDPGITLTGSAGIDFNPTVDRIRVVTSSAQNLRLNPDTGALTGSDTALSYDAGDSNTGATPAVTAVAYNNNFDGSTRSTLFGIDATLNSFVQIGSIGASPSSPNAGLLFTQAPFPFDVTGELGFDISGFSGTAFVAGALPDESASVLYSVSPAGAFSVYRHGVIGTSVVARDIAAAFPDTTAPTLTITSPTTTAVKTRANLITISGTVTDNLQTDVVLCSIGRTTYTGTVTNGSFTCTVSPLKVGVSKINVYATDIFFNNSASTTITVRRTKTARAQKAARLKRRHR